MKKFIAACLCAGMLFTSGIYATPAFAESSSPAVMKIAPVKKGNAYIPEGTKLQI